MWKVGAAITIVKSWLLYNGPIQPVGLQYGSNWGGGGNKHESITEIGVERKTDFFKAFNDERLSRAMQYNTITTL